MANTEIEYAYGPYRMRQIFHPNFVQVSISDVSDLKWPLIWSMPMSKEQAVGARRLFEQVGYFDCRPVD